MRPTLAALRHGEIVEDDDSAEASPSQRAASERERETSEREQGKGWQRRKCGYLRASKAYRTCSLRGEKRKICITYRISHLTD